MAKLNKVQIIGRVGQDPEMKFSPDGKAITTFSVAVSDKRGEKETTEWFNVVTWNKLAEICNEYVFRGQSVYVEGRLHTNKWQTPEGEKRQRVEIIAHSMEFLEWKKVDEYTAEDIPL